LKAAELTHKKILLFLSFGDEIAFSSFINIPNIKIIFYDQPNAYDLACSDVWVFLKRDGVLFKEMALKWN
jgi:hypothetical protein